MQALPAGLQAGSGQPLPAAAGHSRTEIAGENPVRAGPKRVLLVCPPFLNPHRSSLSTAHLATFLRERGGYCLEAYPHLDLVSIIGLQKYGEVSETTTLKGELLFAEGVHGEPTDPAALSQLETAFGSATERQRIRDEFEERCFARLDLNRIDLVGLTTSFHQLMAALFIARGIRARAPRAIVVLGGSACSSSMGENVLAAYPEVDVVVSGWGERPLVELSRADGITKGLIHSPEPVDLDTMPIPDFSSFLAAVEAYDPTLAVALTFESSRGCWWGQKHHCRFCGVNGESLVFHRKSSARVLHEIRTLWTRYRKNLVATDAVLALDHLRHVIPELARLDVGPELSYEIRVNVTEAQVIALKRARVQGQFGVESLSTRLLRLLNKGASSLLNLAVLKWCAEHQLAISWNLLYGIPGETVADYEQQLALMQWIPHFCPPERLNRIQLTRHSPYLEQAQEFGWRNVRPRPGYVGMHPHVTERPRRQMASYFVADGVVAPEAYLERLERAVTTWKERYQRDEGLFLHPSRGLVRNGPERGFRYQMSPRLERVLECTHEIVSVATVLEHGRCSEAALTQLQAHGILYREGDRVLNLAVRVGLENPTARTP